MKIKRVYTLVFHLILLIIPTSLFAQHRKLQNQPYADRKLFHLGFTLGVHAQDLILTQSGNISDEGEVWFSEIPRYSPGFTAGIVGDMYLGRYVNLRVIPSLYLGEKQFIFREQSSGEEFHTSIKNNYISLPVHLKLSVARTNNFRPYILFGGYGSMELASKKNLAVLLKPYDYGLEVGVGCDFYLVMVKIAPELKFSFGMVDILETEREDLKEENLERFAYSLSKATQRLITLTLTFW